MLLVDANGNAYRAHFRHREVTSGRWWRITECTLHSGQCVSQQRPCETPGAFTGVARCSKLDTFDRRKGLKLAFERALWQMYPTSWAPAVQEDRSEIRGQLWASFWTRVRKPRHG